MTSRFRKQLKILVERLKVPKRLVRFLLHAAGLYKRGLGNAHDIQLQRHDVFFDDLPPAFDGYTILMMSDLHIDSELHITPKVKKILKDTPADVFVLTGDYRYRLVGPYDVILKRMRDIVETARTRDGMFAVRGNHDSKELMAFFPHFGVRVLDNESIELRRKNQRMYILGVDEPHYDKADDLPRACQAVPTDGFKILLAHTAEIYKQAHSLGIHFYLCGHTHGGQINLKRIGPIITNAHAPRRFARGF